MLLCPKEALSDPPMQQRNHTIGRPDQAPSSVTHHFGGVAGCGEDAPSACCSTAHDGNVPDLQSVRLCFTASLVHDKAFYKRPGKIQTVLT